MNDDDMTPPGDHALAALYSAITGSGGEFGITLLVGGTWISGIMCSPRAWYEQVAHLIDEATNSGFGVVFRTLGRTIYPTDDEVEAGVADAPPADRVVGFLHMRDARSVDTGGHVPTDGKGFLRIRLDEVSGWMFGNLGIPGYSPPSPLV